jgi:hypothetical protein
MRRRERHGDVQARRASHASLLHPRRVVRARARECKRYDEKADSVSEDSHVVFMSKWRTWQQGLFFVSGLQAPNEPDCANPGKTAGCGAL